MPPVLDPSKSKVDGLAFLGLSLTRKSAKGHPGSETHQTAFDLNEVLDREYEHLFSTNDDGWLVGGGEPGPPDSYKLAAKDTAHVELMRIGTYRKDWGGVPVEEIVGAFESGSIMIPQIEVVPTAVVANPDMPPELEIRFDMEEETPATTPQHPLPINWQLRFVHNQLFRHFEFPSRFCPGAFHSTILRKAEFRSPQHREQYFDMCQKAVDEWKKDGPKPLVPPSPIDSEKIVCVKSGTDESSPEYQSGLWLFTDRQNITHFFEPNFLPPYDTPEKRQLIADVLKEEWDEKTLSWKPSNIQIPTAVVEAAAIETAAVTPLEEKQKDAEAEEDKTDAEEEPATEAPTEEDATTEKKVIAETIEDEPSTESPAGELPENEEDASTERESAVKTPIITVTRQPVEPPAPKAREVDPSSAPEEKKQDDVDDDYDDRLSLMLQSKPCGDCGVSELFNNLMNVKSVQETE